MTEKAKRLLAGVLLVGCGAAVAGPLDGRVLDVCFGEDGGVWLAALSEDCSFLDACPVLLHRVEAGEVLPAETLGTVRSDAAACRLAAAEDGGCLAAVELGEGYTLVSLQHRAADGARIRESTYDLTCYDSPHGLLADAEGGALLLWDSWSDLRGLWVAKVLPDGRIAWSRCVLQTQHPYYDGFCSAPGGGCLVAASPLTAWGDTVMVEVDADGRTVDAWRAAALDSLGLCTCQGIWEEGGGFLSAWSEEPVPETLDGLVLVEPIAGGGLGDPRAFAVEGVSGTVLLERAPGGGFVACGTEPDGEGIRTWIAVTDDSGRVSWSRILSHAFLPLAMYVSPSGLAVVAGDLSVPGEGCGAVCVELGREEVWWTF